MMEASHCSPAPKAAAVVSRAPTPTGSPAGRPNKEAAWGDTGPATAQLGRRLGSLSSISARPKA